MRRYAILFLAVLALASSCSSSLGRNPGTNSTSRTAANNLAIVEPTAGTELSVGQVVIVRIIDSGAVIDKATAFVMPPLESPKTVFGPYPPGENIEIEVAVPNSVGPTTIKAIAIDDQGTPLQAVVPVVIEPATH